MEQLQKLLMSLNSTHYNYSLLYGFRVEFEFRGDVPIDTCYELMKSYDVDDYGVPDGVVLSKKVSRFCYYNYLLELIGEATDEGVAVGRAKDKPNLVQQYWMAALLNGIGYINPRWERLIGDEKLIKDQEGIRMEFDEADKTTAIDEINQRIKTRHPAKAPNLICGMLHNGGCTKAFQSRQELAEYIYMENTGKSGKGVSSL